MTAPGEPVAAAAWLEEQLERALARIDALGREVAHLQGALGAREQEVDALRQSLAVVEGRTRRFEAAQEALGPLRQSLAALEDRLAAESALRRDQLAAAERGQDRDAASGRGIDKTFTALGDRLTALEQAQAASAERDARLTAASASGTAAQQELFARLDVMQAQLAALAGDSRRGDSEFGELQSGLEGARQHTRAVEQRTEVMRRDIQRLDDEFAVLRRLAERETTLADLLEQQRVLRLRVEEGLATIEERLTSQRLSAAAEGEEHGLLRAHIAASDRTLATVAARVDALHEVLLDHFRRMTASAEDAGRRQSEEIDRQLRAARELLVRLAESADEATREQPL